MINNPFREQLATTALEFLDFLRLTNPLWEDVNSGWQHSWLFRGQGLASHPLIPSVWRMDKDSTIIKLLIPFIQKQNIKNDRKIIGELLSRGNKFGGREIPEIVIDNTVQLYYRTHLEILLIHRLLEQALLRGINVPDYMKLNDFLSRYRGNSMLIVRQMADNNIDELDYAFQSVILNNSFFALAQHHGIPTRLLDWTKSPYIAAFFAAESALQYKENNLAVFAAHQDILYPRRIINFPFPKSDNPYLHAQRGELTIYNGSSNFMYSGEFPTVNQLLEQDSDWNQEIQPIMVTLPVEKAPELLRLLAIHEGISRDQLMPTFDNIAYVVKQRFQLDFSK